MTSVTISASMPHVAEGRQSEARQAPGQGSENGDAATFEIECQHGEGRQNDTDESAGYPHADPLRQEHNNEDAEADRRRERVERRKMGRDGRGLDEEIAPALCDAKKGR